MDSQDNVCICNHVGAKGSLVWSRFRLSGSYAHFKSPVEHLSINFLMGFSTHPHKIPHQFFVHALAPPVPVLLPHVSHCQAVSMGSHAQQDIVISLGHHV